MALTINTNISALVARRNLTTSQTALGKSMQRLSSGLRINSSKDDAAGLAISQRMTAQIRGLNQAVRNANDGISMIQTAEGALSEVTNILQRMRELSVQAANSAVLTSTDLDSIQAEITQLKDEINRIAETTQFNGTTLLNHGTGASQVGDPDEIALLSKLQTQWLRNAEQIIIDRFGLTGTGTNLTVVFENEPASNYAAYVTNSLGGDGVAVSAELHVNMAYVTAADAQGDRTIAHELVHAVQGATINYGSTSKQFREGSAEFIHGGDSRVASALAASTNDRAAADAIAALADDPWVSDSPHYAAAYAAYRFLNEQMVGNGSNGIEDMMQWMAADTTRTLDDAFAHAAGQGWISGGYTTEALFLADFAQAAVGGQYIDDLRTGGELANADTGAAGGSDADAGVELTGDTVVPDTSYVSTNNPLVGFTEIWPEIAMEDFESDVKAVFQVGANANENIEVSYGAADTISLGIDGLDLGSDANAAIVAIDRAINFINETRGGFGAVMNRFESTVGNLQNVGENLAVARSRILDADIADETSEMTKSNILQQAGVAILAQANQAPNAILALLRN